jgi:DNA modification methylase
VTPRNTILVGDALHRLRRFASASVDCCITSVPFYLMRDYSTPGQIGLEKTVEAWVDRLTAVMVELRRVLADHGSVWLDLGDSYSRHARFGAPAKSLLLAPDRLAVRLLHEGFLVRNKVIWWKPNAMPDAVTDRLTNTYDVVLHLVKRPRYFYDLDAIRVPEPSGDLVGKNPGDVLQLPAANYHGAHFATFPPGLVERPLLATCPLRVCTKCNTPWQREPGRIVTIGKRVPPGNDPRVRRYRGSWRTLRQPGELLPSCTCHASARPGLVLDPFIGTGTVAAVAEQHGRDWVGIELNSDYVTLAYERLGRAGPDLSVAA